MKKFACFALVIALLLALAACGEPAPSHTTKKSGTAATSSVAAGKDTKKTGSAEVQYDKIDLDLTTMSSTMVYAEVSNLMTKPDEYKGKIVKMQGAFSLYHDDATDKNYYACMIADATACCSQGIEFVLEGEHIYPADYPALGTDITVTGVFGTYDEGEYIYAFLDHAVMG